MELNIKENARYIIRNKTIAEALRLITIQNYTVLEDRKREGRQVYAFENTEKLQEALTMMTKLMKKNREENTDFDRTHQ